LGLPHNAFGAGSALLQGPPSRSPRLGMSTPVHSSYSPAAPLPGAPSYAHFPPTPSHDVAGFSKSHMAPQKSTDSRKDD
jgi:hypothetical protein